MAKTEVILTHNIVGLGAESDQVTVAAGYARNYLIPRGLAIPLTAANKRRLEVLRQRRAEREAHDLNTMNELAASLSKIVLRITAKTGADGKMFGAVTAATIADELKHQCDVSLDRRRIHLESPLRALGEHEVELRLHADVNSKLKVLVESSTPSEVPTGPAAPDARAAAPKGDPKAPRAPRPGRDKKAAVDVPPTPKPEPRPARKKGPQGEKPAT